MPKDSDAQKASPWEEEGRRQAFALDDCAFVLALGEKPEAAAQVALGMGRVQSLRRPVYIVDAVGLIPAIDDLVPFEFRLGIVDVINGVKYLDAASVELEEKGQLRVLPSGPAKLNHADLMANERWMQVTEQLRQRDALMIVVVPADEPAVLFLVPEAYGSVLVGRVRSPTGVTALASIAAPVARASVATAANPTRATATATVTPADTPARRSTSTKGTDLNALLAAAEQAAAARPHAVRRVVGYYAPDDQKPPKKTRPWIIIICVFLLGLEALIWYSKHNAPPPPEEQPAPVVTSQGVVPGTPPAESSAVAPVVPPAGQQPPSTQPPASAEPQKPEN